MTRVTLLLLCVLPSLMGCSGHPIHHRGLASDGYGFVKDGPTLTPPPHLTQHIPSKRP